MSDVIFLLNWEKQDPEAGKWRARVHADSQVMAHASPVFQAMFAADKFKEGHHLSFFGACEVSLPETDVAAFILLRDILHGRKGKAISRQLVFNLANLVDIYICSDAAEHSKAHLRTGLHADIYQATKKTIRLDALSTIQWLQVAKFLQVTDLLRLLPMHFLRAVESQTLSKPAFKSEFEKLIPCLQAILLDNIESCRSEVFELIANHVRNLETCQGCVSPNVTANEKLECSTFILGRTLVTINEVFGPNWRDVSAWKASPRDLWNRCQTLKDKLDHQRRSNSKHLKQIVHPACQDNSNFFRKVEVVIESRMSLRSESPDWRGLFLLTEHRWNSYCSPGTPEFARRTLQEQELTNVASHNFVSPASPTWVRFLERTAWFAELELLEAGAGRST